MQTNIVFGAEVDTVLVEPPMANPAKYDPSASTDSPDPEPEPYPAPPTELPIPVTTPVLPDPCEVIGVASLEDFWLGENGQKVSV